MIDRVLAWVEESGIIDVLLLCPPTQMVAITNHLRAAWPPASHGPATDKKSSHPPSSALNARHHNAAPPAPSAHGRKNPGETTRLRIEVHGLDERESMESFTPTAKTDPDSAAGGFLASTTRPTGTAPSHSSTASTSSEDSNDSDYIAINPATPETSGTARILRRWRDWIRSDFVVLPCDISPPASLPLAKLLNRHRNQTGSLVTSLWYEKSEVELKDPDGTFSSQDRSKRFR